jgi:uncharacterized protein (DUF2336 family)
MSEHSSLIQELEHAISSGTAKKRQKALTLVTDLFMDGSGRFTDEQLELFDDVLLSLSSSIETKARVKLSKRLADLSDAPIKIVRSLAFDDVADVAVPVLKSSPRLTEEDLVETARTKSQHHLHAITQRAQLSEAVTDVLVERGDREVVHSVAKNSGARFSDQGFGKLVARARGDDTLARYVGARRDIPRHHFLKLLESASSSVRAKLEAAHPDVAAAIREVVSEISSTISHEVRASSREHAKAKQRVKRLCKTSQFSESDVHGFARANNFEQTVVALSMLGPFPIELVERALLDESPDMVLILAKAGRCYWSTTKALLQLPAANRAMSSMDLDHCQANYEKLQVNTAKQALDFYAVRSKMMAEKSPSLIPSIVQYADAG